MYGAPQAQNRYPVPQGTYGPAYPPAYPPAYYPPMPPVRQQDNSMSAILPLLLLPKEQDTASATAITNAEALNGLRKAILFSSLAGSGVGGGGTSVILALALTGGF